MATDYADGSKSAGLSAPGATETNPEQDLIALVKQQDFLFHPLQNRSQIVDNDAFAYAALLVRNTYCSGFRHIGDSLLSYI